MAHDGKNVTETGTEADASLTQACSLDVRAHIHALRALRQKHGDDSLVGRLCSNLIPMVRDMPTNIPPAWATHESQTLPGKIRWQLTQLKQALAAS